jgi:MoxR-like ATPase
MADSTLLDEARAQRFAAAFHAVRDNMQQVVRGKEQVIETALLCLFARGHLLVEDVPGVGKTLLAKALGASIGAKIGRIQFTPDLLPADVTGVNVWNRNTASFEFRPGPVFTELVLADEINRASPKTQSALLESMAEAQVTVDGVTHALPNPFMVVATQNPIEQEGTYPLPEAQLDRFLMRISVGYPSRADELQILQTHETDGLVSRLGAVMTLNDVLTMMEMVSAVYIDPALRMYLIDLADATRRHPAVMLGLSPRGTLSMQRVARARAIAKGRVYLTTDDIKAIAASVMGHRLVLRPEAAMQNTTAATVVDDVLRTVPVPEFRN